MFQDIFATLIILLISVGITCAILYFVVRTAVAQAIKDALASLEVSVGVRNIVKSGVAEALEEIEKKKETEQKNG